MLDWKPLDEDPELLDFITGLVMGHEPVTDDELPDRMQEWTVTADCTQVHDDKWQATYDVVRKDGAPIGLALVVKPIPVYDTITSQQH